jgi:hypothetical protein
MERPEILQASDRSLSGSLRDRLCASAIFDEGLESGGCCNFKTSAHGFQRSVEGMLPARFVGLLGSPAASGRDSLLWFSSRRVKPRLFATLRSSDMVIACIFCFERRRVAG